MRVAIVDPEGVGLSWARRLYDEGCDVMYYVHPRFQQKVGENIVPKVNSLHQLFAWAKQKPTVAFFTSSGMGKRGPGVPIGADDFRRAGIQTIGGGSFCDRLEKDRPFGEQIAKAIGCKLPPTKSFSSISQAIDFCHAAGDKEYYFKSEKYLESDATQGGSGEALVRYLTNLRSKYGDNIPNILQEKIPGVALSTACWYNGMAFVPPYEGTIEHKKFMDGDKGPSTGCSFNAVWFYAENRPRVVQSLQWEKLDGIFNRYDAPAGLYDINAIISEKDGEAYFLEWTPRCYSEDTEVLTHEGWRPMRDVRVGDLVASLTDDKELVYVPVERTIRRRHDGPMVHIRNGLKGSNKTMDLLVTPDHAMTFQDTAGKLFSLEAGEMGGRQLLTVRTANHRGLDLPVYTIPAHIEKHALGRHKKTMDIVTGERSIQMQDWCAFLGIFFAEGWLHYKGSETPYQVQISQTVKVEAVREIIEALGFKFTYKKNRFIISSVQLAKELERLGGGRCRAWDKRMPRFIMDLAPKYIESFLEAYLLGDGTRHKRGGQRSWYTTSVGMADDIAECLLRVGSWSRTVKGSPGSMKGSVHPVYAVRERRLLKDGRIFPHKNVEEIDYHGDVVCLTVPNHRLYVRRPGGPAMWCGNCGWDSEATSHRLLQSPLCDFMERITTGRLAEAPFTTKEIAYSTRLSVSPYPWEHNEDAKRSCEGTPIYGVDGLWDGHFIPYSVGMTPTGELFVADRNGLVGLSLATGKGLKGCHEEAMDFLKDFEPKSVQYRSDGASVILKDSQGLAKLGYELPPALFK